MVSRVHGNNSWWCGGGVLSFLFFTVDLSSVFFFSYSCHPRERGDPWYGERCGFVLLLYCRCSCCLLWRVRFQTRHPACADKWFPVCTGMTAGSVVVCSVFCSLPLNLTLFFLFLFLSSSRTRGPIVQQVVRLGVTVLLPVFLSVLLYIVVGCGKCISKCGIWCVDEFS